MNRNTKVGEFTIIDDDGVVDFVRYNGTEDGDKTALCIRTLGAEIIKMRELLQDTVHAFNNDDSNAMLRAYNDTLDYINSLPK